MTPPSEKPKRGLGRGLDALFADAEARIEGEARIAVSAGEVRMTVDDGAAPATEEIQITHNIDRAEMPPAAPALNQPGARQLPTMALIPGPFQPRRKFDEAELKSLAESVAVHGILQPLLVRASKQQAGKFEIIAGERRWRAAQLAQQHDVPVIIRDFDDRAALEIGLIENIQRQDLTPIEEAEGYQRLIGEFGHTQEALAEIVGKSRTHLTNTMRLLTLPESVRGQVHQGTLSAGHARQLIGLDNATELANSVIEKRWSVRDLEHRVKAQKRGIRPGAFGRMSIQEMNDRRRAKNDKDNPFGPLPGIDHALPKDADVLALEHEMGNLLGVKVEIQSMADSSGVLALYFSSLDQLDDLLQKLTKSARS